MDNMIKDLHELCETITRAINAANEKIRAAGGKLSTGDTDYLDRLTHTLKSIKAVIKMEEEADMDDGYSERGYSRNYSMRDGYSRGYDDGYSRGRGRYAKRDSMGRYSSDGGYSNHGNMADELRGMLSDMPDEQTRQEMQRIIEKMERR